MRVYATKGDITTMEVDIIVNAANPALAVGGGVCSAIHKAAGPELVEVCKTFYMGCHTGSAVITPGFNLPASHVIHAVGPMFDGGRHGESILLEDAYTNSLNLARDYKSIAFPAISTGIYGFPLALACIAAMNAIDQWDLSNLYPNPEDTKLNTIHLVAFDDETHQAISERLAYYPQFIGIEG